MVRRNPSRWPLGASALAALAVAGCAVAGADPSTPALHATGEQQLLRLIERARTEAADHNGVGVDSTLARFVTDVNSLRSAGQLSARTAAALDRQALATEVHAARQLRPKLTAADSGIEASNNAPAATSGTTPATAPAATASTTPTQQPKPAVSPRHTKPAGAPPKRQVPPATQAMHGRFPPHGKAVGNPHRAWWQNQRPGDDGNDGGGGGPPGQVRRSWGGYSGYTEYGNYGEYDGAGGWWPGGSGSWAGGGHH